MLMGGGAGSVGELPPMKVAITGGTGFVGRHLAEALLEDDHQVVLLARGINKFGSHLIDSEHVEFIKLGLNSAPELVAAFEGCEAVAHCAGINREWKDQTFESVHIEGTRNVLAACRQTGVRKVLLTSFLRARPRCGSAYHESKWKAEELVRGSGLDYTVFKIGVIHGEGDQFVAHLRKVLTMMPIFGQVGLREKTARPVAVRDVAELMLCSLTDERLSKVTVPVVGPEELSMNEVVGRVADQIKGRPLVIPLPVAVHRVAAWMMEQTMKTPLLTLAQVTMLSEGLSEAAPPFQPLPSDLEPTTPFLRGES